MSCIRMQVVLRMPGSTVGLDTLEDLQAYQYEHEGELRWEPGFFAPSLCSFKNGPFIDFILEDHAPCMDPLLFNYHAVRELSGTEKEKYFPVFLKQFPAFTMEKMNEVHHCKYVWYDGTEAPYLY